MDLTAFLKKYDAPMRDYVALSAACGARADYVQGGGGNTSVKLDERLMAIKASGYRLGQVGMDDGYAVLDFANIKAFYQGTDPATLADVEAQGSAQAKANTLSIDGLKALRPSVEAGFHSLLSRFVLHSHSVYANLVCCCKDGQAQAEKALEGAPFDYCFVPYINPGANLTFSVAAALKRAQEEGKHPSVILLQNHGPIVHNDDVKACAAIHDELNSRIAKHFGVSAADFPQIDIEEKHDGFISNTPWLREKLRSGKYDKKNLCETALYPDQLVFLANSVAFSCDARGEQKECVICPDSGEVTYHCSQSVALTIEQTLCAVICIHEWLTNAGQVVTSMSDSSKAFIASWESEKHRKSLA